MVTLGHGANLTAEIAAFGLAVLIAAIVGVAAVLSARLSERLRIPAPAFFLIAAAAASDLWPGLGRVSFHTVERVVTIALAIILFDGGLRIGWRRFRPAAVASAWVGVAGTIATAAAVAVAARLLFGFDWRAALLIGTALAPTDPAVVFSVLGRKEIAGRAGVLLEGESGANDPVGIALIVALLSVTATGPSAAGPVLAVFAIQMGVGVAVGALGGWALLIFSRRVALPSEGLYTLRILTGALTIYGVATTLAGSGFLAVFVAGILLGDEATPFKREIAHFHSALASLAEIVAFVMLGLTIPLYELPGGRAWLIGLVLAVLLAVAIRPLLVGLLLWPIRLRRAERVFVLWGGLKGAVPILLGAFIVQAGVPDAPRIYEIIFTVVAFSVIVQGSTVPWLAGRLGIPLRVVEPEPWTLGVRFRREPEELRHFVVGPGAVAAGTAIGALPLPDGSWISLVVRDDVPVAARPDLVLRQADEVVVLGGDGDPGPIFAARP